MEKNMFFKRSLAALLFFGLVLCCAATALADDQTVGIMQDDVIEQIEEEISEPITDPEDNDIAILNEEDEYVPSDMASADLDDNTEFAAHIYGVAYGVITKIEPAQVWTGDIFASQYQKLTILNSGGISEELAFNKDFCDGYNYHLNTIEGGASYYTDSTDDTEWKAATANTRSTAETIARLSQGDMVELVLDEKFEIMRIDNYAAFTAEIDPNIQDVKFGVLTAQRVDSGGDYYIINGEKIYAAYSDILTHIPSVVAYAVSEGKVTLLNTIGDLTLSQGMIASNEGAVAGPTDLQAAMNQALSGTMQESYAAVGAVAANGYNSITKIMTVGAKNMYITSDTYLYDLVENDDIAAPDIRGKNYVIAVYDRDGDAIFVAVVGDTTVQPTYLKEFPDAAFRSEVLRLLNVDGGNRTESSIFSADDLEKLAKVTNLSVISCGISDITGLKYFSALESLYCYYNQLTTLDVSNNTALEYLYCGSNLLTTLDISNCSSLWILDCSHNYLPSPDSVIGWQENGLILGNTFQFYPQFSGDPPTGKDITASFKDAGFLASVRELVNKPEGPILDYDVSGISTLNVGRWYTPYTISDLSGIEHFKALTHLYCNGQQLTELDVSQNTALVYIGCSNNRLSALDVSQNVMLWDLECDYNLLTTLDVSNNSRLMYLYCGYNYLPSTDSVIGWQELSLVLGNTFRFYPQLFGDLPTGKDITASFKDASFLMAIRELINKPEGSILDYDVVSISDLNLSRWNIPYTIYDLSGIEHFKALTYLDCNGQQLVDLDVSKNTVLKNLYCYNNPLNTLDVSGNTELEYLDCYSAHLSALDVSINIALRHLDCRNNQLAELDVSKSTLLEWLNCGVNQLITLDVSKNSALQYLICNSNYMPSPDSVIGWQEIGLGLGNTFQFYPQLSGDPPTGKDITASFKDPGFLAAVREIINKPEGPIMDYDVSRISSLNVGRWNTPNTIYDLSGIEHFKALTYLYCNGQQLTELDVSKNTALEYLYCGSNRLSTLNVSQNAALWHMECEYNLLTTLDVSNNTSLRYLYCSYNYLPFPDSVIGWQENGLILGSAFQFYPQLSGEPPIGKDITASFKDPGFLAAVRDIINKPDGPIIDYDVCEISSLNVGIWYTPYTIYDLSGIEYFKSITYLNCYGQQLMELDVSKNTALDRLYCSNNRLKALDISHNTVLWFLECEYNLLTTLDVHNNKMLSLLNCRYNYLPSADSVIGWQEIGLGMDYTFRFYPQLSGDPPTGKDITASFKDPGFLAAVRDIINKPAGPILDYDVFNISSLDVGRWNTPYAIYDLSGIEHFKSLTRLDCYSQQLAELDVSKNITLEQLYCSNNRLIALDISQNTVLWDLECAYNLLTTLDVSNNTTLRNLRCNYNYMLSPDSVIGWQEIGLVLDYTFQFYPQLPSDPPTGKDITASFKDAGFLAAVRNIINKPEGPILDYDVSGISTLRVGTWYTPYTISDLSGIEHFGSLAYLECFDQQLAELDISKNTMLEWLDCGSNKLSALDVSLNTALMQLLCDGNQLTKLDMSKNTALLTLWCYDNPLISLDVTNNSALEYLNCSSAQLSTLNVSQNPRLWYLFCNDNQLTALDVSNNTMLSSLYCYNNYMASPDSVLGWRQLGLTINSPNNLENGNFRFYNQLIPPLKGAITVNFPGITGATVEYYTNVSGWQTVGKFDDACQFVIPDNQKTTWGLTTVRVVKGGMSNTFSKLSVGDEPVALNVPVETITVIGVAAACNLAIVQSDWVYSYTPAAVGAPNEFAVFGNSKKYEVRLYRPGFYPLNITGVDAGQTIDVGSYFYQVEVPAGVRNVWISSYDWAASGANAGDWIVLLKDPNNIKNAKMSYAYGGTTYNVEFKLDGTDPFDLIR